MGTITTEEQYRLLKLKFQFMIKAAFHHLGNVNTGKWRLDISYNEHIRKGNNFALLLIKRVTLVQKKNKFHSLFTEFFGNNSVMDDFKQKI